MIAALLHIIPYLSFCNEAVDKLSPYPVEEEQVVVCAMLLQEADFYHIDHKIALAISYTETELYMKSSPNTSGCAGPLQIKVKYWCPNADGEWSLHKSDGSLDKCDLISRGMFALKYYISKRLPLKEKICLFGPAQNCEDYMSSSYSKRYVDKFIKNYRRLGGYIK